jgi:hypothetical protein
MAGVIYNRTVHGVLHWFKLELDYAVRIRLINDHDLRYATALSSINGMDQLKDIVARMLDNPEYGSYRSYLLYFHNNIIQIMEKLVTEYLINEP